MKYHYRHGDRPIDGYTILRGVGRGGFGEVYYAKSDAGREVALKTVLRNEDVELRGVNHCMNLKSPHLVSIFDVRTDSEGVPFVIMEFVSGPSLRDLLRERPDGFNVEETVFLARETARGLDTLHRNGIVHRDLKPENIFFEDGYVKIGDYGLAKFMNKSQASGQTISVGTVHYMAPEIGSGNYDRTIDIYAFGIILYEFLKGEVPFQGASVGEVLMKHLNTPPDLTGVPEVFHAAVLGALEKDRKARFQSVEEMAKSFPGSDAADVRPMSLSPASLSQIARNLRRERQVASPALGVAASPVSAGDAASTVPPPAQTATGGPESHRAAAVRRGRRPRVDPKDIEQMIIDSLTVTFAVMVGLCRTVIRGIDRLVHVAWTRLRSLYSAVVGTAKASPRAPGTPAQVFWVTLGTLLLGGSWVCLWIGFHDRRLSYGTFGSHFLICGTAGVGYSLFSFYRGLWARRLDPWGRSIRPFLLVSAGIVVAIVSYQFTRNPELLSVLGVYTSVALVLVVLCRSLRARSPHEERRRPRPVRSGEEASEAPGSKASTTPFGVRRRPRR